MAIGSTGREVSDKFTSNSVFFCSTRGEGNFERLPFLSYSYIFMCIAHSGACGSEQALKQENVQTLTGK